MPLEPGKRTPEATAVRRDVALALRRLAAGGGLLAAAYAVGALGGGWFWLLAALAALPGAYTVASARRPFVAPCPGCGRLLGGALVHLPDEPALGRRVENHRCPGCGIYVDTDDGVAREVPFTRVLESPGYELALGAEHLGALAWGDACVRCGEPATRGLRLARAEVGVLSGDGAAFVPAADGRSVPYCDRHGTSSDPAGRALVVARSPRRLLVHFSVYRAYRAFLDANRARVDVDLRALPTGENPPS